MPRTKGSLNKRTIARRAMLAPPGPAIVAGQPTEAYGPGDAYRALYAHIALLRKEMEEAAGDAATLKGLRKELADCFLKMLPFERPRMAPVQVAGDAFKPKPKPDLSVLTDDELDALEVMVLKCAGGGGAGVPAGIVTPADGADRYKPGAQAPRRNRGSRSRKG